MILKGCRADVSTEILEMGERLVEVMFFFPPIFTSLKRKGRTGRNPQTGKAIKISAKNVPKFRPGTSLKKAMAKKKK